MAWALIFNEGTLSVDSITLDYASDSDFDVNALRSSSIIFQNGASQSLTSLSNSHLVGSKVGVSVLGGSFVAINVTFEQMRIPMEIYWSDGISVENCNFFDCGLFNGPYADWWEDSGMAIINTLSR